MGLRYYSMGIVENEREIFPEHKKTSKNLEV